MRVFFDTNVIISAYATRGLSTDVFKVVLSEYTFITGEVNIKELARIFEKKLRLPETKTKEIVAFISSFEIVPKPKKLTVLELRDADDRWVLQSAIDGKCDVLITGDDDLLSISKEIQSIKIMNPRMFWEYLRSKESN